MDTTTKERHDNEPTVTVEIITPEMAADFLTRNNRNRVPMPSNVAKIKKAMEANQFTFNGDTIRIGTDGFLYDGQHRLMAAVETNTSFKAIVVRELPPQALLVIDGGVKRSTQQQMHMATGTAAHVTDTLLMLIRMGIGNTYRFTSTEDLAKILARHPIITETADAYAESAKFGLGGNIPAAELIMRGHGYQARADQWRKVWIDGLAPDGSQTAKAFRERLIINPEMPTKNQLRHVDKREILPMVIMRHIHLDGAVPTLWRKPKSPIRFPAYTVENLISETDFHKHTEDTFGNISTMGRPDSVSEKSRAKRKDHTNTNRATAKEAATKAEEARKARIAALLADEQARQLQMFEADQTKALTDALTTDPETSAEPAPADQRAEALRSSGDADPVNRITLEGEIGGWQ